MGKYKAGDQIVLEIKESVMCDGCFFDKICSDSDSRIYPCTEFTENNRVIFVEKKGK